MPYRCELYQVNGVRQCASIYGQEAGMRTVTIINFPVEWRERGLRENFESCSGDIISCVVIPQRHLEKSGVKEIVTRAEVTFKHEDLAIKALMMDGIRPKGGMLMRVALSTRQVV